MCSCARLVHRLAKDRLVAGSPASALQPSTAQWKARAGLVPSSERWLRRGAHTAPPRGPALNARAVNTRTNQEGHRGSAGLLGSTRRAGYRRSIRLSVWPLKPCMACHRPSIALDQFHALFDLLLVKGAVTAGGSGRIPNHQRTAPWPSASGARSPHHQSHVLSTAPPAARLPATPERTQQPITHQRAGADGRVASMETVGGFDLIRGFLRHRSEAR
jgi:hypothetical protein